MSRIRDIANILSTSTNMATDAEVTSAISDQFMAGKNKIINGDFGIWQRGTTFSSLSNGSYSADRWVLAANKTTTITQQTFTPGTAPVTGYEGTYYLRAAWSADGTYAAIATRLEDVRLFAGQTITISYWAKANANVTNTAGYSQYFGTGGSTQVSDYATNNTITTSWQRFTATFNVPSISGKTIGTSNYFIVQPILIQTSSAATIDVWGVQLEAGSTATDFTTSTGTIQGELAACQRYYYRHTSETSYTRFGTAIGGSTTLAYGFIQLPVPLRANPNVFDVAGSVQIFDGTNNVSITSFGADQMNLTTPTFSMNAAGGIVTNRAYQLIASNNTTAYIGFGAEL
jgi:hypothetical protein